MSIVKMCTGEYYNSDALEKAFHYCFAKCEYWEGTGIRTDSIENGIFDMRQVKILTGKVDGKQLYHMVIGIRKYRENSKNNKETENCCCRLIGYEVSKILYDFGYQNAYFKHKDGDNRHLHFIINSVNFMTGKKLSDSRAITNRIMNYIKRAYPFLQWDGPYYV